MQTLACWIVLRRGNIYVRGEPVLWNCLKLDCHWCFNKGLRTSLCGEIIACWNKNGVERRREMTKMTRFMLLPQLSLPFDSVKICILYLHFNHSGKIFAWEQIKKEHAWNMQLHMDTCLDWMSNLWWEECDVGRVSEDETICFSTHLRWVKKAFVVRIVDEHAPARETKKRISVQDI